MTKVIKSKKGLAAKKIKKPSRVHKEKKSDGPAVKAVAAKCSPAHGICSPRCVLGPVFMATKEEVHFLVDSRNEIEMRVFAQKMMKRTLRFILKGKLARALACAQTFLEARSLASKSSAKAKSRSMEILRALKNK